MERDLGVDRVHDGHNIYARDEVGADGRMEAGEDRGYHIKK